MDHALSKSREAEGKLAQFEKALAKVEKKYKDSLFHLADIKKRRKNAEATLGGFERQTEDLQVSLKKVETQLALAIEQTKLQQKQLEAKDAEKAQAKQATYDAGMTKTA